ncbi:DUF3152 domain-containing protein [Actinomycetes bacterium KLBMP 9797]
MEAAERRRLAEERMRHRRRRAAVLALLSCSTVLVLTDLARDERSSEPAAAPQTRRPIGIAASPARPTTAAPTPSLSASASPSPSAPPSPSPSVTRSAARSPYAVSGPGTFRYATRGGPLLGKAGTLRRFQVAVENGMGTDPTAFAVAVDRVLGDPRSWIAGRQVRFQRVPHPAGAEFTIFLATPATSERMCAAGGLATEQYTSCRLPGQVIINVARWLTAVPRYGAPIEEYQAYAVNHEVGHQLGHGHEACPGPGAPAPTMLQQTLGLRGCVANAWPYLNGRRYAGAPIP